MANSVSPGSGHVELAVDEHRNENRTDEKIQKSKETFENIYVVANVEGI